MYRDIKTGGKSMKKVKYYHMIVARAAAETPATRPRGGSISAQSRDQRRPAGSASASADSMKGGKNND